MQYFVDSVLNFPIPDGQSGQQTVDMIQKKLETLGAEKTGNFAVDSETYQSQSRMSLCAAFLLVSCYDSAGISHDPVCLRVCLSHSGIVSKWMHRLSCFYVQVSLDLCCIVFYVAMDGY